MTDQPSTPQQAMQDGPNTHRYRGYRGTTYHVVTTTDIDGVQHWFHVPEEVVNALAAPEQRQLDTDEAPETEPYCYDEDCVHRCASEAREPLRDAEMLFAGTSASVARVLHRWKHPSWPKDYSRCRCPALADEAVLLEADA